MTSKPKQMAMFSMEVENLFSADKRVWQSLSDEDREKFIDDVFDYYRESGFPYASYTDDELLDDFYDLQHLATSRMSPTDLSGNKFDVILPHTAGQKLANAMMPHLWEVRCHRRRGSPMDTFNSDKYLRVAIKKVIQLQNKMSHSAIRGALSWAEGSQKVSNFRPSVAKHIYDEYAGDGRVIDFSCGFGGRLVAAFASKRVRSYVGFEPSTKTYDGLQRIVEFLFMRDLAAQWRVWGDNPYPDSEPLLDNVFIHKRGSEDNWAEIENEHMRDVDLCFSSPPYFSTEEYSYEETQSFLKFPGKNEWRDEFLAKVMENCVNALKKGGYLIVNVANVDPYPELEDDTFAICKSLGVTHTETLKMAMPKLMGKGGEMKSEPVFIFKKE